MQSLLQLFAFISKGRGATPYGLASVLQNVLPRYVPVAAKFFTDPQNQVMDPEIEAILFHMMKWPLSVRISTVSLYIGSSLTHTTCHQVNG